MNRCKIAMYVFLILLFNLSSYAQIWTLQQCLDTALVNNKTLKIARNSMLIGNQKHMEAMANLMPKITANADYRYYTDQPYQLMPMSVFGGPSGKFKEAQFGVPHNINANLQLAIPLYNPTINGAIQTSKVAAEISGLQYNKTEEQIYYEITNYYYNSQILHHQLTFIDSNIVNATKLFKNMQLLKEHLLAKETDVNKVQLQIDQLITQRETVTCKYEQVLNALRFTIGIPLDQTIQIENTIDFQNANDYLSLQSIDIRIAETQKQLVKSELTTLIFSRLPTLSLYGSYGTTGLGYDKQPNDFMNFYPASFAGVQLSYPLFNGTITQRKINQKKLELKNSELQMNLITEQRAMALENAKRQRNVAQMSTVTLKSQIKHAQNIYDLIVLQQKQGVASLTDVLLSDNSLREAQQAYIAAIIDYLKADIELKKITGNIATKRME